MRSPYVQDYILLRTIANSPRGGWSDLGSEYDRPPRQPVQGTEQQIEEIAPVRSGSVPRSHNVRDPDFWGFEIKIGKHCGVTR